MVEQVLPTANAASRTVSVRLRLPNEDGRVLPGFFAQVTLVRHVDQGVAVPKDAVVNRGTETHVVAVRDGAAVIVPVEVQAGGGATFIVLGDLKVGEQVVVRGNESLRTGQPLDVLNPAGEGGGVPPTAPPAGGDNGEPAQGAAGEQQ